jgi:hypothetical protein
MDEMKAFTAFHGNRRIAGGLEGARKWVEARGEAGLLCFEDQTGRQVDFNWREPLPPPAGPGRPKLGVVSREISLLPRHWEWLEAQPNGASAAIRRLVDQARAMPGEKERRGREAAGRFLTAMAGNLAGYEETTRALYAGDLENFVALMAGWPKGIREYAARLAGC